MIDGTRKLFSCASDQEAPTLYVTYLPQFTEEFKNLEKGIVFYGRNFVCGLFGRSEDIDLTVIEE